MKSYKEIIKEITNKTSIPRNHIFDYDISPMYDIFDSFYEFYYEALQRNNEFGIEPNLIFFNNNTTINASASLHDGHYIVQFNAGTIYYLSVIFLNNSELLIGTNNDEFIEFEKQLDVSVNELMYQNASHFTFYHELAHLIQNSELLKSSLFEYLNNNSEYSQLNHILELDADKFSSICIGSHVIQYIEKQFGEKATKEQIEKTLIIICSSALFYILSFSSNKLGIYYKKKSHPHPVIRISCIVFHILTYVKEGLTSKGFEVDLKKNEIIRDCVQFSYNISVKRFNDVRIEDYVEILSQEANNISNYIKEFEVYQNKDQTLASNKWNERAENLK